MPLRNLGKLALHFKKSETGNILIYTFFKSLNFCACFVGEMSGQGKSTTNSSHGFALVISFEELLAAKGVVFKRSWKMYAQKIIYGFQTFFALE